MRREEREREREERVSRNSPSPRSWPRALCLDFDPPLAKQKWESKCLPPTLGVASTCACAGEAYRPRQVYVHCFCHDFICMTSFPSYSVPFWLIACQSVLFSLPSIEYTSNPQAPEPMNLVPDFCVALQSHAQFHTRHSEI